MKGIIALDIDGTITSEYRNLDPEVINYFTSLYKEKWVFVFITGRTFFWGYEVLRKLDFPYYFAVHNGATIFKMPECQLVSKKHLHVDFLEKLEQIFDRQNTDYILYTEKELAPVCYYRPNRMPSRLLEYLKERMVVFQEEWIPVEDYKNLPFREFTALKYFGLKNEADRLLQEFEQLQLHAPMIKDPFNTDYYIIQATHAEVSKGHALKQVKKITQMTDGIVIAAGDDLNDASMLASADIRIVMATAPEILLMDADIIAPPANERGIICGLKSAISRA